MRLSFRQDDVFIASMAIIIGTLVASSIVPAFSESGGQRYSGLVRYDNGTLAIDGTIIRASINGNEVAATTVLNGKYNFTIPDDNPATPQRDGGINGDLISFELHNPKENIQKLVYSMPQTRFQSNSSMYLNFKIESPIIDIGDINVGRLLPIVGSVLAAVGAVPIVKRLDSIRKNPDSDKKKQAKDSSKDAISQVEKSIKELKKLFEDLKELENEADKQKALDHFLKRVEGYIDDVNTAIVNRSQEIDKTKNNDIIHKEYKKFIREVIYPQIKASRGLLDEAYETIKGSGSTESQKACLKCIQSIFLNIENFLGLATNETISYNNKISYIQDKLNDAKKEIDELKIEIRDKKEKNKVRALIKYLIIVGVSAYGGYYVMTIAVDMLGIG